MRIAVAGASGKMGRLLIEAITQAPDLELTVALDQASCSQIGHDAGAAIGIDTGVKITHVCDPDDNACYMRLAPHAPTC